MHPTLKRLRSFACPLTLVGVVVLSSRVGLAQGFNPNGATQLECDGQPACLTPQLGRAIHAEHPELKKMLDGGSYRSATFRHLVEQLDETTTVAYVRFDRCAGGVGACLRFVASQGAIRRVLIVLDRFGRSETDLTVLLAHELRHALEIAQAPHVVDKASLRAFYESTGLRLSNGFETAEAIRTTRIVASELSRRGSR